MNALYAGSLGIAAALVGSLAGSGAALASEASTLQLMSQPAREPSTNLFDPPPAGPRLQVLGVQKSADAKRKMLALTDKALPGASQFLGVLLYPTESGMSINKGDGTAALTFAVMPTKITHGKGIVAIAKF